MNKLMDKLRDFKCTKTGQYFERFVKDETKAVNCKCGSNAKRCLSAPKCFQNTVGKSPSAR